MRALTGGHALIMKGIKVPPKLLNLRGKLAEFEMAVSLEPNFALILH